MWDGNKSSELRKQLELTNSMYVRWQQKLSDIEWAAGAYITVCEMATKAQNWVSSFKIFNSVESQSKPHVAKAPISAGYKQEPANNPQIVETSVLTQEKKHSGQLASLALREDEKWLNRSALGTERVYTNLQQV